MMLRLKSLVVTSDCGSSYSDPKMLVNLLSPLLILKYLIIAMAPPVPGGAGVLGVPPHGTPAPPSVGKM